MNLFYQKDHDFFNPRGLCRLIFFEAEMRFAQLHLKRSQKYPPENSHERNAWFFVKKRSTIIFGLKCCCSLLFSRTGSRILRHRKPHNFVSSTFERILAVQRSSFHVHHSQNPCSSIIFSNNQFLVLVVIVIVGNFIVAKVQNLTAKLPQNSLWEAQLMSPRNRRGIFLNCTRQTFPEITKKLSPVFGWVETAQKNRPVRNFTLVQSRQKNEEIKKNTPTEWWTYWTNFTQPTP